jgi:hypothetical protein
MGEVSATIGISAGAKLHVVEAVADVGAGLNVSLLRSLGDQKIQAGVVERHRPQRPQQLGVARS